MAVLTGVKPRPGQKKLSWPVFVLTLAAVTSSSLSALSLVQLLALRAEIHELKSEVCGRREEGQTAKHGGQTENICSKGNSQEPKPEAPHAFTLTRKRRVASGTHPSVSQACLQMLANISRKTFRKELPSGPHTGIPWQSSLRRGSALEMDGDSMLVREEGFYFVYSQVYYKDTIFAMGHVVIRRKKNVVGDESPDVTLFRCIQDMKESYSYNTCYTGGIAKLEEGDHLELLIPRPTANISLDGDCTFLGAVKLA